MPMVMMGAAFSSGLPSVHRRSYTVRRRSFMRRRVDASSGLRTTMMIDTADITETTDIAVMMTIDVMSIATGNMIIAAGSRIIATGTMIIGMIGAAMITKMSVNAALSSAKTHRGDFGHRICGVVRR